MARSSSVESEVASLLSQFSLKPSVSKAWAKKLLVDWVQDHLEAKSVPASSLKEVRDQTGKLSEKLAAAQTEIAKLPDAFRFELATLIGAEGSKRQYGLANPQTQVGREVLTDLETGLDRVGTAATVMSTDVNPDKRAPRRSGFIMMIADLAAIYELLTGEQAKRKVRNKDHPDTGKPYGTFFRFVSSSWALIPRCAGVSVDEQIV